MIKKDSVLSKKRNTNRDLQNILKLSSSRHHDQRARMISVKNVRVTTKVLLYFKSYVTLKKCSGHDKGVTLADFCMEMFDGGK